MEKIPGGWGVMADDVMAGIMAYFVVLIFYAFT
jgi:phosphatidylglycerophosphatase A